MAGRSNADLDVLVEQAIVDAYDEYEQLASFHVMELRRRFRGDLAPTSDSRPRRTVAELLDAAAEARH